MAEQYINIKQSFIDKLEAENLRLLQDRKDLVEALDKATRTGFEYTHHDLEAARAILTRLEAG